MSRDAATRVTPLAHTVTGDLLAAVAAKAPVPGGGAVAALIAGLGAALGEMVVNYSIGRKSLAEHEALHAAVLTDLAALRERSLTLADDDARAYARLNELWRLDASDPRRVDFDDAVRDAIAAPMGVVEAASSTMGALERLLALPDGPATTNRHLDSDLAMAAILALAAAEAAAWNVRINLPQVADEARRAAYEHAVTSTLDHLRAARTRIDAALGA